MSKKKEAAVVVEEGRRWEGLNPEILASIFVKIQPSDEMVRCVPFVCKPWNEVVAGPYCWWLINVWEWCRRHNDSDAVEVNLVVEKLVRRSKYMAQLLSALYISQSGFISVVNCGRCLKVLQIPRSGITDDMVSNHIKPLPNLQVLDISYCSKITHKGIEVFGNHCKSLVRLRRNMHSFYIDSSPIDDSESKAIAHTIPNLKRLELRNGQFGDSGLSEIFTECKSLTHLDIYGCLNVGFGLDGDLWEKCQRLEHFKSPTWFDYDDDPISSRDVDFSSTSD